jgi:hypothetical protein
MSNPTLPDDVFLTLVEVCDRHPGPVQEDRLFGDILNEVAWRHRDQGFGLSRKAAGRHVESPVGPIAEDVLQRRDGHHWDVLGGAAVGQPLRPGRSQSIGVMTDPNRPWVAPVEPAGHVPPDREKRDETDVPGKPRPTEVDLSGVMAAFALVTAALAQLEARVDRVTVDVAGKASSRELHELVQSEVMPHLDDVKRIVLGLPRDPRFL